MAQMNEDMMPEEKMDAPHEEAGAGPQGEIGKLVQNVGQGLAMLTKIMQSADGAPAGAAEQMGSIAQAFMDLVSSLSGGQPEGSGAASPEQGASRGAVPAGAAMR